MIRVILTVGAIWFAASIVVGLALGRVLRGPL